jgi:hypothetical protein
MYRRLGWILLGMAGLVISGFVVQHSRYWEMIDFIVMLVGLVGGLLLLRRKR